MGKILGAAFVAIFFATAASAESAVEFLTRLDGEITLAEQVVHAGQMFVLCKKMQGMDCKKYEERFNALLAEVEKEEEKK